MRVILLLKKVVGHLISIVHTFFIVLLSTNVTIGNNSIVYYRSSITNLSRRGGVKIGKNCKIGCSSIRYHAGMPFYTKLLNDGVNSSITIGDNCRINGASIHSESSISIGDNCVFASGVSIMDSNGHDVYSNNRTIGRDQPQPISIGDNVWIGINAIVMKGSSIGDNSVISAGSVVKGVFPPNSLIAGNPAIVQRHLKIDK